MTFNLCSYHQLWVKWVFIYIGNSPGHIGQTHTPFPKCQWMFDTELNAYQFAILNNFFDQGQPHQHVTNTST